MKLKLLRTQYLQVYRNELSPDDFGFNNLEILLRQTSDKNLQYVFNAEKYLNLSIHFQLRNYINERTKSSNVTIN